MARRLSSILAVYGRIAGLRHKGQVVKVFFLDNGLTHYYNQVLNRLNTLPGVEMIAVVPKSTSASIGDAVKQTRQGINFRVCELAEYSFAFYSSFRGLRELLVQEKPDIVIVGEFHLFTFVLNIPVILAMRRLGSKLILKSIPFRIRTYDEAKKMLDEPSKAIRKLPRPLATIISLSGVERLLQRVYLSLRKRAFTLPDAHADYTERAYEIFGSYGVPREKIFITSNSPDTDIMLAVRASLEGAAPVLPPCEHRIIHVGRLVEWKRVDMLIRALARVRRRFPDAELVVAGFGPEEDTLKQLAAELGLQNSVHFLGGVYEPGLLGKYFLASSLYVLAGMGGLSINDAMCFGLPVICSVCDGTEQKLVREGENGRYFRDGDEDDLTEKIIWMFEHPEERKRMGEFSTQIIRNEVNINTVLKGFADAFAYVTRDMTGMP